MKIQQRAKTTLYYLLLFWATKECIQIGKYFTSEQLLKAIEFKNQFLIHKKQRDSKKIKKETQRLLKKISEISCSMEKMSFEMIVFISLNYLVLELNQKDMKNYKVIPITEILDDIYKAYPEQLKLHYKFFEKIEAEI